MVQGYDAGSKVGHPRVGDPAGNSTRKHCRGQAAAVLKFVGT
jgi:hypothetical protein